MKEGLTIILIFVSFFQLLSQWTQVNLYTGDIRDIGSNDSLVFVSAGNASLYKSGDPLSGWTYWGQQFMAPPNSSCVDVKDNIIFCGGSMDEIFRSTDNGNTWSNSILNPGPFTLLNDVCIGDSFVFALTNYGLYRSADTGDTWQVCNVPLQPYFMERLYDDGSAIYVLSEDSGLYRSSDNGITWLAVNNGFYPSCQVKSLVRNGSTLILGTFCGYVYRSVDNGFNWTMTGMGTGSPIICMTVNGTDLYAGTYAGVFKSEDNGYSWTSVSGGINHSPVWCIGTWGNKILAGTSGGVYLLTVGNILWSRVCDGILGGYFLGFSKKAGTIYTFDNTAGVFYSTDNGDTWEIKNSGLPVFDLFLLENVGSIVYTGSPDGVFMSSVSSPQWNNVPGGLPSEISRTVATLGNDIFLGFDNGQVFRSSNSGMSWTSVSSGLPGNVVDKILPFNNELYVYANENIYYSDNSGTNWNLRSHKSGVDHFIANPVSMMISLNNNAIMTSADQGLTWTSCTFPIPPNVLYINDMIAVGYDYFVSCNKGVFHSSDNGLSWTDISAGLPVANTEALGYDGTYLFVDTERHGVFRLLADLVTWGKSNIELESWKVFPNPADDFISISGEELISLIEVTDITGRIVFEKMVDPSKRTCVDISSLNQGLYFVKINNEFSGCFCKY